MGEPGGGGGVAGDHDHLDALGDEPRADLLDEPVDLAQIARPVRASRGIADIYEGLLRQRLGDLPRNGQAAESRIEHADGRA